MVIALPFFAIYLFENRALRQRLREFLFGFIGCGILLGLPFALSDSALRMLFSNPEMTRALAASNLRSREIC